jgi:hypothetical protein
MAKRIQGQVPKSTIFQRQMEIQVEGHTIANGDIIKVKGEYGLKFKFTAFVTNSQTGATWIDCFEVYRGQVGAFRSFTSDRIKRIPKKRVKKNVNRRATSTAS